MVAHGVGRGGQGEAARFVLGALLGVLLMAATTLVAVRLLSGPAEAPPRQYAVAYPAEPRPTPYWPFREEWLTPRPKG